jgi:hypothetical protein
LTPYEVIERTREKFGVHDVGNQPERHY